MLSTFKLMASICKTGPTLLPVSHQMHRCFASTTTTSTTSAATDSPMAQLRRKTGYAFSLCRKALDIHSQDMTKAEQWLRAEAAKQGWERAERVRHRPAGDGLIGVVSAPDQRLAAMLELNCETDFVAKNGLFAELAALLTRRLPEQLASGAVQHSDTGTLFSKIVFGADQLSGLCPELVVDAIGKLGENIRLSKACIVRNTSAGDVSTGSNVHLIGYTHAVGGRIVAPSDQSVLLGKYGTIIALKAGPIVNELGEDVTKTGEELEEIGKQLSQHIIGLNPKSIEPQRKASDEDIRLDDEPTALLEQSFIFDEDLTVSQVLNEYNIKVLDFVRFECGLND